MFKQHVIRNSLPFPHYLRCIKDVEAHDIESWVRHAVSLDRNFATVRRRLHVRRVTNSHGLAITWLRLIRGRWALVASADVNRCELMIWEIPLKGEMKLAARKFVEAPVIDGVVDESETQVQCAITIGASSPYILIIRISQRAGEVMISQLTCMPGVSHVRFLQGSLIGFAVHKGDDEYPYIADLKAKNLNRLYLLPRPAPQIPLPIPLEPCVTMTIKSGYIFTLHRYAIHIFALLLTDRELRSKYASSLSLKRDACKGHFSDISVDESREIGLPDVLLRVYYQDYDTAIRQAVLVRDEAKEPATFTLVESQNRAPPYVSVSQELVRYAIGLSGRRAFFMVSQSVCHSLPDLSTIPIRLPRNTDDCQPFTELDGCVPVLRDGLPLSQTISDLAFDDGRGLLLIGTVFGDVRLASFMEEDVITRESICMELPEYTKEEELLPAENQMLSSSEVVPNLPVFYEVMASHEFEDDLAPSVREEVTRYWFDPRLERQIISGWSNDWTHFECIWDWIAPFSRWGHLAKEYMPESSLDIARGRLQALGDIIPILYDVTNHKRVVFRIGERMFYCREIRDIDDDDEWDAFEDEPDIFLGILPYTYSQFLVDHIRSQRAAIDLFHKIRKYHTDLRERFPDDTEMESWSGEVWERIFKEMC